MNSGAMFGNLDRYASYDYWKAHPRVFFQTPEGMEEYRIAAVLKADVSMFDFQQASFHSPKELEVYAAQAKALSLFETGVAGAGCETTLTLVTCSYEWEGSPEHPCGSKSRTGKVKKCSKVGTFFSSLDVSCGALKSDLLPGSVQKYPKSAVCETSCNGKWQYGTKKCSKLRDVQQVVASCVILEHWGSVQRQVLFQLFGGFLEPYIPGVFESTRKVQYVRRDYKQKTER